MENLKNEIVVTSENNIVETADDLIALAERRLEKIQKLKMVAMKSTNESDWCDMQGKPYLTSSGAEKVARLFGVKISNVKSEKIWSDDEKGKFYYYLVTGVASLHGGIDSMEAVGTCSSKDAFFAKARGEYKLLSEIDETNIMKAAYSNFMTNAITRLLGIRNMTWEEINQSGIDSNKVAKVEYNKGGQGGISGDDRKLQEELGKILMELALDNKDIARTLLVDLTKFTTKDGKEVSGVDSCLKLTGKRLEIALHKAKDLKKKEQEGGK
jgi:hypothetical protein